MSEIKNDTVESSIFNLRNQAELIPYDERKRILLSFRELDLQKHLKELFMSMEPVYTVEVTQGAKELGKDLVLFKQDKLTTDVIGVVVKLGNVKGKTLGDVDEVIKDVHGAFDTNDEEENRRN